MLRFVDARNAVMQGSTHPTKETLSAALKLGAPLRADADLQALDKKLAPNAAVAFVSRPGSAAFPAMMQQRIGAPARYLYATFHVTDRLELHAAVGLASADTASAIAAQMQPKLAAAKAYFDRFDERADGDTVYIDVAVTEDQLKALVNMVQAAMGN
jgi:hypothetical protein